MSHVIALVDDDRNILTSVSIALQQEGFVTRVYSDSVAALKALSDNPPDLGVFDIKMPNLDGMELLRRVREFSAMPILADAIQDAGCDSDDILSHCRGEGPHVRGCWVVDLVLGKE